MATLKINADRIIRNAEKLDGFLRKNNIQWTLVTKVLSGHREFLKKMLYHPVVTNLHSVGDSRISGLRAVKEINPAITTMYVKPAAMDTIKSIVNWADISLNSSFRTIEALNNEAINQNKIHRIIIMIEMGELREGVLREQVISFYERVFGLSNIRIEGLGTNLGCMYGIQPTYDKLVQLSLYKLLIEQIFKAQLPLISGGSSITLPLVGNPSMPKAVNHLRIGESVFLGTSPFDGKKFRNLSDNAFQFEANIIELEQKATTPDGVLTEGNIGHTVDSEGKEYDLHHRAIVDFGLLDVDPHTLQVLDSSVKFVGVTSDMSVYDLGPIQGDEPCKYKVGDKIKFTLDYMAIARLMNSKFVDKRLEYTESA